MSRRLRRNARNVPRSYSVFFFNDTATTEIYTLSLHDALPICATKISDVQYGTESANMKHNLNIILTFLNFVDRKSTRLNSSHSQISYAVFCLKKKNPHHDHLNQRDARSPWLAYYEENIEIYAE